MRKLYIECGTTLNSQVNSGIQRVVRNILREAEQVGGELGFDCVPVEYVKGGFAAAAWEADAPGSNSHEAVRITHLLKMMILFIDHQLTRVCRLGLYQRVRQKYGRRIRELWGTRKAQLLNLAPANKDESPPVLLLLDSTWDVGMWPYIDEFRSAGGCVCAVLYDLIPFTHPDTVAEGTRAMHTAWWGAAHLHVDAVMCISRAVKQDYLNWFVQKGIKNPLPPEKIGFFNLGSELSKKDPVIRLLMEDVPFFLVVGSLEPRKNHKTVLDAFDVLWKNKTEARLVIVGAYGWKCEALLDRIRKHPELDQKLFLIRNATDRDLTALYQNAEGLVIASIAEGFGLPIVEAIQYKVPVICSDIPVFREVAADQMATFFNPLDADSLVNVIRKQAKQKKCVVESDRMSNCISWRQSAEQLLGRVKEIALQDK